MSAECDGVLERVWSVLDGELSPDEVAVIQHHLEACAPCLGEYEVEAALKALVRRSCTDRAPETLRARIVASITRVTTVSTDGSGVGTVTQVTRTTVVES